MADVSFAKTPLVVFLMFGLPHRIKLENVTDMVINFLNLRRQLQLGL